MVREKNSIANGRRLNTSNFYFTINTNKRVKLVEQLTPAEQAYYERFEKCWRDYFDQSPDEWLKFLKPGDNTANSIKSISKMGRGELQSSARQMIHAHVLIEITHFTKLHMNFEKLQQHLTAIMGNNVRCHNIIPGKDKSDLDRIRAYIRKEEKAADTEYIE